MVGILNSGGGGRVCPGRKFGISFTFIVTF